MSWLANSPKNKQIGQKQRFERRESEGPGEGGGERSPERRLHKKANGNQGSKQKALALRPLPPARSARIFVCISTISNRTILTRRTSLPQPNGRSSINFSVNRTPRSLLPARNHNPSSPLILSAPTLLLNRLRQTLQSWSLD
jgi:hypothetical protein